MIIELICLMRINDYLEYMSTVETNASKEQLHIGKINPNLLELISKCTFAVGLLIELTIVILDKSEYIIQYEGQWFRLTFVLFGISLITTKHSIKEWITLVFFWIIGLISYRHTGRNEIIRFVTFIWACQGKNMQKVLRITFWFTLVGCVGIVFLSITGMFGAIAQMEVFRLEEETRYCFGMGHPNTFHCMVFVLTILGIYCYYTVIRWYGYVLLVALQILVFYFTKSRTGLILSLFAVLLVVMLQYMKFLQKWKLPYILSIILILALVAFSVFAAKNAHRHYSLLAKINKITTGRLHGLYETKNHEGMLHTWSLWSVARNNYYFDMGIVRIFYWYGIIPGAIYFWAQIRLLWVAMKKYDYMLLAIVTVIALYSVFEAHFVSVYLGRNYLLFLFGMYLSDMIPSTTMCQSQPNQQ